MSNLYTRLSALFPADASKVFAWPVDGPPVLYSDVAAASARYANAIHGLGVRPGDRVAVQARKSIDMLMLYLGCLRAGAIFLPLNTEYTPGELDYFISDAEPALFVCDATNADAISALPALRRLKLESIGAGSTLARRVAAVPSEYATIELSDTDPAAILYTSGTTGRSKGAVLTHGNLSSNAMTLRDVWRFSSDDVLLHALPIFHTHGLFVATNVTLAAGASMIFLPRFDVDAVLGALPRSTVMMGVPTFYLRLLGDRRFTRELVLHMRLFISGSAPLAANTHREFSDRTGHAILERYGMTETNMNTSNPYDGERIAGTVGLPLPDVTIRVVDPETGRGVEPGEVGMIEIAGPNVFSGYWRMPEKTASEFHEGFFVSGDLGLIDRKGYVSIVGRGKDLIICGGYNVYPAEVETALDELPQVLESAVIGAPHPDMGEGVVAIVVPSEKGFSDGEALKAELSMKLARFKQPRRIVFVDQLPRNTMGKVQKAHLRQQYADSFQL